MKDLTDKFHFPPSILYKILIDFTNKQSYVRDF